MHFSEKYGYSEPRPSLQTEALDQRTRNRLWNVFHDSGLFLRDGYYRMMKTIWDKHLSRPLDEMPSSGNLDNALKRVFTEGKWYLVIDIVEVISDFFSSEEIESDFNEVLEEEKSAYRIIDGEAVPVSDELELEAIEEGMEKTRKYEAVREHLEQALAHFSDEDDPDYRNSVKESISAAESMAQIVIGDENATLGQALSEMEREHGLNGALKSSFSSLYGYASDQEGIRHALSEKSDVSFAFAKFMLVNCTAFVNYLIDEYEAE